MTDLARLYRTVTRALDAGHALVIVADLDVILDARAPRSRDAGVPRTVRETLRTLAAVPTVHIGLLSQRPVADIRARVGLAGIVYARQHGADIDGLGVTMYRSTTRDDDAREADCAACAATVMTVYFAARASDDMVFRSLDGAVVTVGVGPATRTGSAMYWLADTGDVHRFLALLAEDIGDDGRPTPVRQMARG